MFFLNGRTDLDYFEDDGLSLRDFDRNSDGKVQVFIDTNGSMRGAAVPISNIELGYIYSALDDLRDIVGIDYEIVQQEFEFGELTLHKIDDLSNFGVVEGAVGISVPSNDGTRTHVYWESISNNQQLEHVIYHEIGHAYGLDHPSDVYNTSSDVDLMGYKTDGEPIAFRDINVDELRSIYHQYELKNQGQQDFVAPNINDLDPLSVTEDTEGGGTIKTAAPDNFNLSIDGVYVQTGSGNDTITGSEGNDFIRGGSGDDVLNGGLGDDIIRGGNGFDFLTGQGGADSFYWTHDQIDNNTDYITDFNFGEGDRIYIEDEINYSISGNIISLTSVTSGQTLFTDVVIQNLTQIDNSIIQ